MKDYHKILNLQAGASRSDIQQAYRKLAKLYHPDVSQAPDAHERFCDITEAYEFLVHHAGPQNGGLAANAGRGPQPEVFTTGEAYDRFRKEAREKAHRHAQMTYERFRRHHEAFQESGIEDLMLLITICLRVVSIPLILVLSVAPLLLAFLDRWQDIFIAIIAWPFAFILAWYFRDNRKHYLMPGRFFYTPERIWHMLNDVHPAASPCYYCPSLAANSRPYVLELYKPQGVLYHSSGYRMHQVRYLNKTASLQVPRSRKALLVHTSVTTVRLLALLLSMIFLPLSSLVWRFIGGLAAGALASWLVLAVFRTRSCQSYLVSTSSLIRATLWLLAVILVSRFSIRPVDISTNGYIYLVIVAVIIFDSFVMQLLNLLLGSKGSMPLVTQYPEVMDRFREGFMAYNDIPALSVIYPLFRWITG